MIIIPGYKGYSFDPATNKVWSNMTNKFIKPLAGYSDVYQLKG